MFYAQINEENICVGVSSLSGEVKSDSLIRLETFDTSLLGKKYTDGLWEEVPKTETEQETPEPTNAEIMEAVRKSQDELKKEAIDAYTLELIEAGIL